ncbi:hypothetical protein [Nocardiopsis trehalosi]|jgi:hypothetical protein|uniref:hypothetical protein n=1 Tax=Nocardiopsis trehalosi TaxID=109329 RepID=UPI00082F0031|nr:hypothetical protein [Nocardiopsis trehalosi]
MNREIIAHELGIPERDVTDALLRGIAEDPLFLHHLMVCKDDPEMLALLLGKNDAEFEADRVRSDRELLAGAGTAMARWAAGGFTRVDDENYKERLATCSSCEHLTEPPKRFVYSVLKATGKKTVCGLCGCDVRRKARLATEHCPDGRWRTPYDRSEDD